VARILLDGLVPNIQVSWVKLGIEACQAILQAGANDFGGTLMELSSLFARFHCAAAMAALST